MIEVDGDSARVRGDVWFSTGDRSLILEKDGGVTLRIRLSRTLAELVAADLGLAIEDVPAAPVLAKLEEISARLDALAAPAYVIMNPSPAAAKRPTLTLPHNGHRFEAISTDSTSRCELCECVFTNEAIAGGGLPRCPARG